MLASKTLKNVLTLGEADYTSGESEEDPTRVDFKSLTVPADQQDHIRELWRKCWVKANGASSMMKYFGKINERIQKYGSTKNLSYGLEDRYKWIASQRRWYILMPDDQILFAWNGIMILLLFYCATYLPYSICFFPPSPDN